MYSTSEAAEKLGLSQDHVRLLARTGIIEAKKLGHDWVVLNLDYKRKRKLKVMNYFELTPPGREAIPTLERQSKDDEAERPVDEKPEEKMPEEEFIEKSHSEEKPEEKRIKGTFLVYNY